MRTLINPFFICLVATLFYASCGSKKSEVKSQKTGADAVESVTDEGKSEYSTADELKEEVEFYYDVQLVNYEDALKQVPELEMDINLNALNADELRQQRNLVYARKGYLFMQADVRDYFKTQTKWYEKIMLARWYGDCEWSGLKEAPELEFTTEEQIFLDRIKLVEKAIKSKYYQEAGGYKTANTDHIVNKWQFENLNDSFYQKLEKNGFVIVPNNTEQFFQVYEQNDYSQTPNFITTDMFLQLNHIYFSFLLRDIEENHLLRNITDMMIWTGVSLEKLESSTNIQIANAAAYNKALLAVGFGAMDKKKDAVITNAYADQVKAEIEKIESQEDKPSSLLSAYSSAKFPYSLFKPRGHYTRTDKLKNYFKGVQWLQQAVFCHQNERDLERAIVLAWALKGRGQNEQWPLYQKFMKATTFFFGEPDNVSLADLAELVTQHSSLEQALANMDGIMTELAELEKIKNRISPKQANTCKSKLNFMPSRYMFDNEILQELVDIPDGENSGRPYPKGLDVFAVTGNETAKDILYNEYQEPLNWEGYTPAFNKLSNRFKNFSGWEDNMYNYWMHTLFVLNNGVGSQHPFFMQNPAWNRKNLITTLASWAELKHNAILYAEQPGAAECGNGGECPPPPHPYVVGYVEPNVAYWNDAVGFLDLLKDKLQTLDFLSKNNKQLIERMSNKLAFMKQVSEKELAGQTLTEDEYRTLESYGAEIEYMTLSIMNTGYWGGVIGPDRQVAVVADVYTQNGNGYPKAGILHEGVGNVNDLYVVVEINGYLYLTKGGIFDYYEFVEPLNSRLTDEEWQAMIKEGKMPETPKWIQPLQLHMKKKPDVKSVVYSSGC